MICGYLHPTFERWLKAIDDKEPVVRRTIRAAIGVVAVATMVAWYNMFTRCRSLNTIRFILIRRGYRSARF